MSFEDEDFTHKSTHMSWGGGLNFGVRVSIAGIEPTNEEKRLIDDHVDLVHKGILLLRAKNDPKRIAAAEETKRSLLGCFRAWIYAEAVPNRYHGNDSPEGVNNPWFIVTTDKGRLVIGWRKRVIVVDWSDSRVTKTADELFPQEDVTKEGRMIHAWGYDKAREYVAAVLSAESK